MPFGYSKENIQGRGGQVTISVRVHDRSLSSPLLIVDFCCCAVLTVVFSILLSRYWTEDEHSRFLEALQSVGPKDVKAIAAIVSSRSATQVRTHAQKYFLKLVSAPPPSWSATSQSFFPFSNNRLFFLIRMVAPAGPHEEMCRRCGEGWRCRACREFMVAPLERTFRPIRIERSRRLVLPPA